jgi:hypothetical protein
MKVAVGIRIRIARTTEVTSRRRLWVEIDIGI